MSFSNELKNECARIHLDSSKLMLAELSAFIRTCGEIKFENEEIYLEFATENASIARRIYTLLKSYTNELEAFIKKNNQLKKNSSYIIIMKDKYAIDDLLYDTDFVENSKYEEQNFKVNENIIKRDEEVRAFLRASFLGAGSITNPEKGYHLEMIAKNEQLAEDLKNMLNKKRLNGKISNRKSSFIVYLKEAELISDFMALVGAHQSLLKFENIRIVKDLRNNVNRVVNCETANIAKTVTASMKQVEDIEFLIDIGQYEILSEDIKEIAQLRLENEDSSLKELSEKSVGKYSRSGINYRLKKISSLADKHRGAKYEGNEN